MRLTRRVRSTLSTVSTFSETWANSSSLNCRFQDQRNMWHPSVNVVPIYECCPSPGCVGVGFGPGACSAKRGTAPQATLWPALRAWGRGHGRRTGTGFAPSIFRLIADRYSGPSGLGKITPKLRFPFGWGIPWAMPRADRSVPFGQKTGPTAWSFGFPPFVFTWALPTTQRT